VQVGRAVPHEAAQLAVDRRVEVDVRAPSHLAAKAQLGVLGHRHDARAALAQRGQDFVLVQADAGNDADAGDDHAAGLDGFGHGA